MHKKVNLVDTGTSFAVGKQNKKGGVVLKCVNESADIKLVRDKIQEGLGDVYEATGKNLLKNRVKIIGIDQFEHDKPDEVIAENIINQYGLDRSLCELKIVFKSALKYSKFSLIIETNLQSFKTLMVGRIRIGWSLCRVVQELDVVRCYNCSQYGHLSKYCKKKTTCPIYADEDHLLAVCKNTVKNV